jgi:putative transcription factor
MDRYCELCGRASEGPLRRITYFGEMLFVCGSCFKNASKSATKLDTKSPVTRSDSASVRQPVVHRSVREKRIYDIVEDYPRVVREARERAGMNIQDLALRAQIKESVLRRIEAAKLVPDYEVARKIEKVLRISLLTEQESESEPSFAGKENTLELKDVAKLKDERR